MNYCKNKSIILLLVICSMLSVFNFSGIIAYAASTDTADLTFDVVGTAPANVGDIFQVAMNLSNISSGTFYSADTALYFDPTKLQVLDVDGDSGFSGGVCETNPSVFSSATGTADNAAGLARFAIYILPSAKNPSTHAYYSSTGFPASSIEIVSVRFKVIATGDTQMQLAKSGVAPAFVAGFPDGALAFLGSSADLGTVNYTKVPFVIQPAPVKYGDINGDNIVNLSDAVLCLKAVAGTYTLTDSQKIIADVTGDGVVNLSDAVILLKYVAGTITTFPVQNK